MKALRLLKLAILQALPGGVVADPAPMDGLIALMSNANAYSENINTAGGLATSGTAYTVLIADLVKGVLRLTSGASGGFTITLPATSVIISAFGPTVPTNGTFSKRITIINEGIGQIGTVTAGDASTTLTGTMTLATNTVREFLLTVTAAGTITLQNLGSKSL